jgi:thymidylate synthase
VDDLRHTEALWPGGKDRGERASGSSTPSACPPAVNDLGPPFNGGMPVLNTSTRTRTTGFGVDQILNVIDGIKSDPHSRRHVLSAWQVSDLTAMALPPCHSVAVQFYVRDRELSCSMYQRSVDVGPGPTSSTSPATPC